MPRPFLALSFLLLSIAITAQERITEIKRDNWYAVEGLRIFQDGTRNMGFDAIQNQNFSSVDSIVPNLEASIWRRFKVPSSDITDTLILQMYGTDSGLLYVPKKGQYKKIPVGTLIAVPQDFNSFEEKYIVYLDSKDIDYERHFYLMENIKMLNASDVTRKKFSFAYLDRRSTLVSGYQTSDDANKEYHFYVGITFMSFLLFFIGFIINKNNSFLVYSLYLLALVIYYGNRTLPLLNFYNKTVPELYFYVNQTARAGILWAYSYFLYVFLDIPNKFKRVHLYAKCTLICIAAFSILHLFVTILFPLLPGRFELVDAFYILAAINGLVLVILMFFSKPDKIAVITLLGTLLVNAGSVFSIYLDDFTILLKVVLFETLVFFGIISYQNKMKEKEASQNLAALEIEKREKESLKQLDLLKSRLFANISHEFKTPLTLIKTPLEDAIRRREPLNNQDFSIIYKNTNRLDNLINNLLSLSKLESSTLKLKVKRGNPILQISELCSQFKSYAQSKRVTFNFKTTDYRSIARYDHELLATCVNNLLSNAMKFTDEGDSVELKAGVEESWPNVEVSDSGMGIAPEEQKKIFDRFYQVAEKDESRPGSGIGLSMVKELVQLHEGTITVKSVLGKGSTFLLGIPLDEITEASAKQMPEKTIFSKTSLGDRNGYIENLTGHQKNRNILIVEDNEDLLQFLTRKLEHRYQIKTAKNGKRGCDMALKWLPDLIVSDVMMPKMNGIELCKALKNNVKTAHIPIILLTAKSEERDELAGLGTGADAYITKPFTLEKLELVIEQRIELRKFLLARYQKRTLFEANAENLTTVEQDFLQRLQQILQNRLTDPSFNTEKLAEEMGLSRMQLYRKMKNTIAQKPSTLIRIERLGLATTLLKDSKLSVKEVAYESGFNSPSYFIKVFKEQFNTTPSDYMNTIEGK
ncbi:MAG: ATP-binding protein [Croceivirga sp.]